MWIFGLLVLGACKAQPEPEPQTSGRDEQPPGWDEAIAPKVAEDLNPDPSVLEVNLEARIEELEILPGVQTAVWTYNGSVPGPLLRARRGDRLIVHFTNHLPEPTTIHWHGMRVPASMDGTHAVQDPVEPGESFTYEFELLDAGTFWYHPHINSSAQVGYGLYGPIVVDDPDDPLPVDDVVLVLSDMSLDDNGQLQPGDKDEWFGDFFGREGSVQLVNGQVRPRLRMKAGVPQRWRVINAARARYFQIALAGAEWLRVGGDGGLIDRPLPLEVFRLAASERADVLVTLPEDAVGEAQVMSEDADRFHLGVPGPPEPFIDVEVVAAEGKSQLRVPETLRKFPELEVEGALPRSIELGERVVNDVAHLAINGEVHDPSAHVHSTDHVAYVGDTEIWEVVNATDYDHPFHLHGFSFQVLDVGGRPWPVREWKDSVNVPRRETLRFVVTYDDRPGLWMFHCHILDHAQLGMMAVLDVRRRQ